MSTSWSKTTKYVVAVGVVLLGIFVLYMSRAVIPLLIVAGLIAMIARPLITWLHVQGRMPRGLAVAIVYLLILIIVPLLLLLAVPAIIDAVQYVVNLDYPRIIVGSMDWLRSTLTSIRNVHLPVPSLDTYVDQMVDAFLNELQEAAPTSAAPTPPPISSILQSLGTALTTTFGAAADLVGALFSTLTLLIFMFLASIYMSLRAHTYRASLLNAIPAAYQPEIGMLMMRIGLMWNAFFRGQITLMLIIGVVIWLGLTILGVPGAVYLGIVAGLLEIVPNLGPVIAAIPAVIVALLQGSTYIPVSNFVFAGLIILFYVLVQQLENNLIVPRVLGDAVELPPLVV
ncbi:MAG TPA: AI-2E family transporter, partial [Anaerolineaceae bacterium]|nr:AI-2E family transporter [Anaerolineaceae bacterium]